MLRTRLYLGLLPLLLLFIVVGLAAMLTCRELAQSIQLKLVNSYGSMIGCFEMRDSAKMMVDAIHQAQTGHMLEARSAYSEYKSKFQRVMMDQAFSSAGTPRAAAVERINDAFEQLSGFGREIFERNASASFQRYKQTEDAFFKTLSALEDITKQDYAELQSEARRVSSIVRTSIDGIAAAMAGGILLSLFLSYRLARSLLRPIRALTISAAKLGEGTLDREVPVTSRDELGELAHTFNTMAAKLRVYREATTAKVMRVQRTMEATLSSTPDPLFVVDSKGVTEVKNPAAQALASAPEFAEGFPPALSRALGEVLATGQHYLPEDYDKAIAVHVGRGERHYLPRVLAIGDALTGFGGAAVILQDVTKFRLLDDAKSNLVGTVSHELKTPLTSLRMAVYLLLEKNFGALSHSQRDLLETARDDADRLLRILNDLLDLSRLEGGVSSLNRREVAISSLLEDMAREMKGITEAADQKIEVRAEPDLGVISVDPERLRHVFINLLANASKYSRTDSKITLSAQTADAGFVRFSVRDEGPGIPEESVGRIFEKFYRVPGQTRKGAGLGLTIAREITVAHGGTIGCVSKVGEGSEFYFLLPRHFDA